MRLVLSMIFIMLLGVTGCDKAKVPAAKSAKSVEFSQPIKINGPLLAKVNDWAIGLDDFNSYLEILKTQNLNVDINSLEFKQELLSRLVNNQILAELALERGMDQDSEVQKALRNYKSTLLAEKMTADLEKNLDVPFAEVKDFYEKNKQLLVKPKQIKLREIGLNTEQEAKDLYIRILQGEDFGSLAQSYSALGSGKNSGILEIAKDGYISLDQNTVKDTKFMKYWETAAALGKGEKSSIFKGDDNKWYILKIEDIKGGDEIPLTEVQNDLTQGLKVEKAMKEINKAVSDYKARAKVEVNQDLIK